MNMLQKIYTQILKFLVPPHCFYCRSFLAIDAVLCNPCLAGVRPLVSATLTVQQAAVIVYAVSAYKGPVKRLILAKNYRDVLASHHLGVLMWERTLIAGLDIDCIVPVPLHWTRYVVRGYNQADEIAQVLAARSGKPIYDVVQRRQKTRYQAELSAQERAKNVRNAFQLAPHYAAYVAGKHVLIVDDLMTTGSTLCQVAKVLFACGARKVSVVVAARVV